MLEVGGLLFKTISVFNCFFVYVYCARIYMTIFIPNKTIFNLVSMTCNEFKVFEFQFTTSWCAILLGIMCVIII